MSWCICFFFFFFNDTATTEIYTLSLHDALPISGAKDLLFREGRPQAGPSRRARSARFAQNDMPGGASRKKRWDIGRTQRDRKSTRLNSSHLVISYAVFCLKKKKNTSARII